MSKSKIFLEKKNILYNFLVCFQWFNASYKIFYIKLNFKLNLDPKKDNNKKHGINIENL